MLIDLKGRVAIVTGSGRGIGYEIAKTLAAEGVTTVVTDIRQDLLDAAKAEWERNGWTGSHLLCDVRSADQCRSVAAAVEAQFGRIDILVNNAGVATGGPVRPLPKKSGTSTST